MSKLVKLFVPAALLLSLGLLLWGANKVRHTVNQPTAKSVDIAIPKVNEAAIESMHQRSTAGQFDTKAEVSNTRDNPFEHYSGYVAPAAPTTEPAATTEPTTTTAPATSGSTATGGSTAPAGSTSSSTGTATESSGDKQLPTLPSDLKAAGF
ncbi:MAG: hypothetical protein Q7S64_01195 [bacterium]|nr:hypothetical protein [bacterium]